MCSLAQIELRAFGVNLDVLDAFRGVPSLDSDIYKIAVLVGEHLLYTVGTIADISTCLSICPKNIFAHVLIHHLALLVFEQVHGDESGIIMHNHNHCLISSCMNFPGTRKLAYIT